MEGACILQAKNNSFLKSGFLFLSLLLQNKQKTPLVIKQQMPKSTDCIRRSISSSMTYSIRGIIRGLCIKCYTAVVNNLSALKVHERLLSYLCSKIIIFYTLQCWFTEENKHFKQRIQVSSACCRLIALEIFCLTSNYWIWVVILKVYLQEKKFYSFWNTIILLFPRTQWQSQEGLDIILPNCQSDNQQKSDLVFVYPSDTLVFRKQTYYIGL